jgi:hypothetical protein
MSLQIIAYHCIHFAYHFIASHRIAYHCISFLRSSTPAFKTLNPDLNFKALFQKSISKPGFLFSILSFANPRTSYFKIFSQKTIWIHFNFKFQSISIHSWGPLRWCRSWILLFIKFPKFLKVSVRSGLCPRVLIQSGVCFGICLLPSSVFFRCFRNLGRFTESS